MESGGINLMPYVFCLPCFFFVGELDLCFTLACTCHTSLRNGDDKTKRQKRRCRVFSPLLRQYTVSLRRAVDRGMEAVDKMVPCLNYCTRHHPLSCFSQHQQSLTNQILGRDTCVRLKEQNHRWDHVKS